MRGKAGSLDHFWTIVRAMQTVLTSNSGRKRHHQGQECQALVLNLAMPYPGHHPRKVNTGEEVVKALSQLCRTMLALGSLAILTQLPGGVCCSPLSR